MRVSAYEVFRQAERIELAGAELYRRLGARFAWPPDQRAILGRLEAEEIQHAARVRLLASQYRNDPRLFDLTPVNLACLDALEAATLAMIDELDRGRWDADPAALRERLADLEEQCGSSHADVLADAAASDAAVARFFRQLAEQDQEHARMLQGAVAKVRRAS